VLGVAKAHFRPLELPPEQHDFVFDFLGLIGLVDPVRSTVADAVKECYSAGIRVIMITGDYPDTARSIAERIGLTPRDEIMTGPELERIDDRTLRQRIKTVCIFARTMPEQKLRLVQALKANGDVVAMTGDGVNDAPALKAADIGVAMGKRGTDVAREASSLVLLDDDFSSIVCDVRSGVSWIHGKLVPTVSGANGVGVAVLRGAVVGVADGGVLVAAPCEPLATDAVGISDGAFVAEEWC
jgi:Ca2+-transporting ATPase